MRCGATYLTLQDHVQAVKGIVEEIVQAAQFLALRKWRQFVSAAGISASWIGLIQWS